MKKILALFLIFAMLIPLCVVSASAAGEPVVTGATKVLKARNGAIEVDGQITADDQAMAIDTWIEKGDDYVSVGASWDLTKDELYLGLLSKKVVSSGNPTADSGTLVTDEAYKITSVTVALENDTYTWNGVLTSTEGLGGTAVASDDGSLLELAIPLDATVVYQRSNGDVYSSVKITVESNSETKTFDGILLYVAENVVYSSTAAGEQTGEVDYYSGTRYGSNNEPYYTIDRNYGYIAARLNRGNTTNGSNVFLPFLTDDQWNSTEALFAEDANGSISFDYWMTDPEFASFPSQSEKCASVGNVKLSTSANGFRSLIYISMGSVHYDSNNHAVSEFVFSIYRIDNKALRLYYDNDGDYGSYVDLNAPSNNWFKLSMDWSPIVENDKVTSYLFTVRVNGRAVGTITATAGQTRTMPLWRSNGVALGIAYDDLSTNEYLYNRDTYYRNLAFSSYTDTNAVTDLLHAHGFLIGGGLQLSDVDEDDTYNVRFLAQISDLDYETVGFEVVAIKADGSTSAPVIKTTNKVYTSVQAGKETKYAETGKYFMAITVDEVPSTIGAITFVVRPFIVTATDSVTIYGDYYTYTVPETAA